MDAEPAPLIAAPIALSVDPKVKLAKLETEMTELVKDEFLLASKRGRRQADANEELGPNRKEAERLKGMRDELPSLKDDGYSQQQIDAEKRKIDEELAPLERVFDDRMADFRAADKIDEADNTRLQEKKKKLQGRIDLWTQMAE